jgi:hypothetical protein
MLEMKYAPIMAGGAIGSLLRYILQRWGQDLTNGTFPLGTLGVNVIGCVVIGLSNGATLGVMFAALFGGAALRYHYGWLWAIGMAVGIEACMLVSPYPKYFNIVLNTRFVTVTLFAHLIFGAAMGLYFAWHARAPSPGECREWPPTYTCVSIETGGRTGLCGGRT